LIKEVYSNYQKFYLSNKKGEFMKVKVLLSSILLLGSLSYAAEVDSVAQEVMSEVKNIEARIPSINAKRSRKLL